MKANVCHLTGLALGLFACGSILSREAQAATLTTVLTPFTGNDASVLLELDELANGNISVNLNVIDTQAEADQIWADFGLAVTPTYADLRGVFFNIGNEDLLDGLSIVNYDTSVITAYNFDANNVTEVDKVETTTKKGKTTTKVTDSISLQGNPDLNPCYENDQGCDGGLLIGTSGLGKDDIGTVSWEFSWSDPSTGETSPLSLEDFSNMSWGVRATSVGTDANNRNGSTKLVGVLTSGPDASEVPEPGGMVALMAVAVGALTTLRRQQTIQE